MQERRKREIRKKANSFREKCKVSKYGIIDLFQDCKRQEFKLLRYPLGENADFGFTVKKDNDIIIFTNSCSRLSREIFTLAHEIGHVILHLEKVNSFIDNNITINEKSADENEQEANYFAACLLMPRDDVFRFIDLEISNSQGKDLSAMDIARIMSEFKVSFDMTLNRLESLDIIDINQKLRLNSEKIQKSVDKLLRNVGGNVRLNEHSNAIDMPYEYIDYAIYNYNYNAIPEETLRKVLDYFQLDIEDVRDKIVDHNSDDDDDLADLIGGLDD